ncbi:MAG: ABC transporter substrate-binding protein [Candidatus Bathyarchaeia archaeon]
MQNKAVTKIQAAIIAVIIIIAAVGGVVYFLIFANPPTQLPPKDKIVIGYAASLSGAYSSGEIPKQKTVFDILVEDWNAKGGIYVPEYNKRLPIEGKIEDAKSDIETYVRLVEKFLTVDNVDLLFSCYGTASHYAVSPLLEKYKCPMITITATSDKLTASILKGEVTYLFPIQRSPATISADVADFLKSAGAKKVGLIYILELFGIETASALYGELVDRKMRPVVYEGYPMGVSDLSPLIKKLKDNEVDAMVAYHYPADGILLIRQCIELDYSPTIWIGGDGIDMPAVIIPNFGTDKPKGMITPFGFCSYDTNATAPFAQKYKERIKYYPAPHLITLYVAYDAMFKLIEKYGLNKEKIRDILATETFATILGDARFDAEKGFVYPGRGALAQWQGGEKLVVIWPSSVASASWIPKPPWP